MIASTRTYRHRREGRSTAAAYTLVGTGIALFLLVVMVDAVGIQVSRISTSGEDSRLLALVLSAALGVSLVVIGANLLAGRTWAAYAGLALATLALIAAIILAVVVSVFFALAAPLFGFALFALLRAEFL